LVVKDCSVLEFIESDRRYSDGMRQMNISLKHIFFILWLFLTTSLMAKDSPYNVTGLKVDSISQTEDDEEAPFDIKASNKRHKCGGKASNLFRVHSEYIEVARRRYDMALNAMIHQYTLSLGTHGCKGNALIVNEVRLHR
jgi:hypothetical protein